MLLHVIVIILRTFSNIKYEIVDNIIFLLNINIYYNNVENNGIQM